MRSDVRRNRRLILDAAQELFATTPQVPLYEVARRAGVGQGTLYRHFPDRSALAGALMRQELDRLRTAIADREDAPGAFGELLEAFVDSQVRLHQLASVVREGTGRDLAFAQVREQIAAIFARPLVAAQTAGIVHSDLTTEDVLLIPRMLDGAMQYAADAESRTKVARRCLKLLSIGYNARQQ
ncbi:TetR/AcrR family transcriptional regulator [Nocardia sp. R16R-3T]